MYTVLLCDDEEMILKGLTQLISWDDYGLEIAGMAHDGEEAFDMLSRLRCDILVTDIRMPRLDGIGLLERMRSAGMDTKVVVISGYDDFAYIQGALRLGIENYLLKPVNEEELSATLLSLIEKMDRQARESAIRQWGEDTLRDNVVRRWLHGQIAWEELEDRARLLGIGMEVPYWQSAIVLLDEVAGRPGTPQGNAAYRQAVEAAFCRDGGRAYAAVDGGELYVLVSAAQAMVDAAVRGRLVDALETAGGGWAAVLLGNAVPEARQVADSFAVARKRRTLHDVAPELEEEAQQTIGLSGWEAAILAQMDGLLDGASEAEVGQVVGSFFDQLQALEESRARYLLGEAVARLFADSGAAYWQAHPLPLEGGGAAQTRGAVLEAALEVACMREKERMAHPVVGRMIEYVQLHYAEDISLKTLSAQVHFSAAYLGQIFKQHTGRLFLDYLCEVRIEKAKLLLLEGTHKSVDIAKMVGFRNPNYFANVFRKMTGVYPTVWRKQGRGE